MSGPTTTSPSRPTSAGLMRTQTKMVAISTRRDHEPGPMPAANSLPIDSSVITP